MLKINYQNVTTKLGEISGMTAAELAGCSGLVATVCTALGGRVIEERCSCGDIENIEYAAAAWAFYETVIRSVARGNRVRIITGKAIDLSADQSRMNAAKVLLDSSRERIAHLLRDEGFAFKAAGDSHDS